MQPIFNLPQYKRVNYLFSARTGYYTKTDQQPKKQPVNALPYELKREDTQAAQIKCNAKECLTKHEYSKVNGSRKLLTGLQATSFTNWFTGNHLRFNKGQKINSLLLIHFSTDNSKLTIFFFSGYFKNNEYERQKFAAAAIPQLLRQYFINAEGAPETARPQYSI